MRCKEARRDDDGMFFRVLYAVCECIFVRVYICECVSVSGCVDSKSEAGQVLDKDTGTVSQSCRQDKTGQARRAPNQGRKRATGRHGQLRTETRGAARSLIGWRGAGEGSSLACSATV